MRKTPCEKLLESIRTQALILADEKNDLEQQNRSLKSEILHLRRKNYELVDRCVLLRKTIFSIIENSSVDMSRHYE
jgi:hypothetical protein